MHSSTQWYGVLQSALLCGVQFGVRITTSLHIGAHTGYKFNVFSAYACRQRIFTIVHARGRWFLHLVARTLSADSSIHNRFVILQLMYTTEALSVALAHNRCEIYRVCCHVQCFFMATFYRTCVLHAN